EPTTTAYRTPPASPAVSSAGRRQRAGAGGPSATGAGGAPDAASAGLAGRERRPASQARLTPTRSISSPSSGLPEIQLINPMMTNSPAMGPRGPAGARPRGGGAPRPPPAGTPAGPVPAPSSPGSLPVVGWSRDDGPPVRLRRGRAIMPGSGPVKRPGAGQRAS